MDKEQTRQALLANGVIAVIRSRVDGDLLHAGVEALVSGGVRSIEITRSTPNTYDVIRSLVAEFANGRAIIGAGTITTTEECVQAIEAGAQYVVSPIVHPGIVEPCIDAGVLLFMGAFTPTEVYHAHIAGADYVKIFPAGTLGPDYISALRGPFPDIPLVPTGGIGCEDIAAYRKAGAAMVGCGSQLAPSAYISERRTDDLRERAVRFAEAFHSAPLE